MSDESEQINEPAGGLQNLDLTDAIGKLMAHPEILSMASAVLSGAPPGNADTSASASQEVPSADMKHSGNADGPASALPELAGLVSPLLSQNKKAHGDGARGLKRSIALLLALKPYLSPARCETVDKLVQAGKIGELLEKLH